MILTDMRCHIVLQISHIFAWCDPCGETEEGFQGISFYDGSGQTLHCTCGFPTAGRLLGGSMACIWPAMQQVESAVKINRIHM